MKKRIIALLFAVCLCSAFAISASAVNGWSSNSYLSTYVHYIPILNDTAQGVPGTPSGYDFYSLHSQASVTAYSQSSPYSDTKTTYCYTPTYVQEGWSSYTSATASIRSMSSAYGSFSVGDNNGTVYQSCYWSK